MPQVTTSNGPTTNGGTYSLIANVASHKLFRYGGGNPGTTYYYIVSATNSTGESANSIQASAIPLPSLVSTNLNFQTSENQLQLFLADGSSRLAAASSDE